MQDTHALVRRKSPEVKSRRERENVMVSWSAWGLFCSDGWYIQGFHEWWAVVFILGVGQFNNILLTFLYLRGLYGWAKYFGNMYIEF